MRTQILSAAVVLAAGGVAAAPVPDVRDESAPVRGGVLPLPLAFERNDGQTDPSVRFVARAGGATLFVRPADLRIAGPAAAVTMRLDGARGDAIVEGEDELPGRVNWCLGRDPAEWRCGTPTFRRVVSRGVWPGVDVVYRGTRERVEYDFVVEPGADPSAIALSFDGADRLDVDPATGDLVVTAAGSTMRQGRPVVYQEDGGRRDVAGEFVLMGGVRAGFRVGDYDPTRALVVDPPLAFLATFTAGYEDHATGIAVDAAGDAYLAGSARSAGYSTEPRWGLPSGTEENAFVTKLDRSGRFIEWTTYFGGQWSDSASALALGPGGSVYVCGHTRSPDFPVTAGALDTNLAESPNDTPGDAFVTKLTADGAIAWSTFWGDRGDDLPRAIAVKPDGRCVVAGVTASDLPAVTASQFQPRISGDRNDAFVLWLAADGTSVESMTYLGGVYYDFATSLALDSAGNAVVVGGTASAVIAGTSPQRPWAGGYDLFVAKFASGDDLRWFTYLGGSGSEPGYYASVALDAADGIWIGSTTDSIDFPTTASVVQHEFGGGASDGLVAKLDSGGGLAWATYFGSAGDDYPLALALDRTSQRAVVTGTTDSASFLASGSPQPAGELHHDAFVARIGASGSAVNFSTRISGPYEDYSEAVAVAADGGIYACGTLGSIFKETPLAYQCVLGTNTGQLPYIARYADDVPQRSGTISLTTASGKLVDRSAPTATGTDSFRASGRFTPPEGRAFDPIGRTVVVSFGDPSGPVSIGFAPYMAGRPKHGRFTWSTPKRFYAPDVTLTLDTRTNRFTVSADGFAFPVAPTGSVSVSVMVDEDDGFDTQAWSASGPGKLRLKRGR
jgi:hypothetical protein